MTSAETRTAAPGIEELEGKATACGQVAVEPVQATGQIANEPARTCGQDAAVEPAEPARTCGQEAVESAEPAKTCGQSDGRVNTEPATTCGQGATQPTGTCGQAVVEPVEACGQESAPTNTCGQGGQAAQHRRLDQLEMESWRAFLAASTSVTARLNHELEAGCGISMHEYEILVRLSEAPDRSMRMSTLAEHVSHSRSRLTHTVGRLEKEGYVMRVSCASDKRGVNCELTDAGLAFLRQAAPVHLDGVRRHVVDRLSRDQLGVLFELMKVISESPDTQAA